MKAIVEALLSKAFDYAGMFPPSKLELNPAVDEFRILSGEEAHEWLLDRFICPANQIEEMDAAMGRMPAPENAIQPTPAAIVAAPVNAGEDLEKLQVAAEDAAKGRSHVLIDVFEVKFDGKIVGLLKRAKPAFEKLDDADVSCLIEVAMTEANAELLPDIVEIDSVDGIKMRMGGVTPEAFPSPEIVATFLSQIDALECPYKFTAGLHEPIRYFNSDLGAHHHGFLNVLVAMALIRQEDLSIAETVKILETESPTDFDFQEETITVNGHRLEIGTAVDMWELCSGIGSCSITEPLQGLQRLGVV